MATVQALKMLNHLQALGKYPADLTDRDLLDRFVGTRDEGAFAELVRRHGSLVLGASRRIVGNLPDAEEVFQATFFTLAQKAASTGWRDCVAPWLYRTACHLAWKQRAASRRRPLPLPRPESVDPGEEISLQEALATLDEEMARLPGDCRTVLILCHLQGKTRDEAARQLGWSLATLRRRLERGRRLLQLRLERRGVAWSVSLLSATLVPAVEASLAATVARQAAVAATRATIFTSWLTWAICLLTSATLVAAAFRASPPEPALAAAIAPRLDEFGDPLPDGARLRLGRALQLGGLATRGLAFSPDGQLLAVTDEEGLGLWDTATGRKRQTIPVNYRGIAYFPDGHQIAGIESTDLTVWDLRTGRVRFRVSGKLKPEDDYVFNELAVSPDGKRLATVGHDKLVRLWDADRGQELARFTYPETVRFVRFAPDGRSLGITGDDRVVRILSVPDGRQLHCFPGKADSCRTLAFSPDGRFLAIDDQRYEVRLIDLQTGHEVRRFRLEQEIICSLEFTADGKHLAVSSFTNWFGLWDVRSGELVQRFDGHTSVVGRIVLSPNGKQIASSSWDYSYRLWDIATGREAVLLPGHLGPVLSAMYSPDGRTIAATSDKGTKVRLWDARMGRLLRTQLSDNCLPRQPLFSSEGHLLTWKYRPNEKFVTLHDPVTGKASRSIGEGRYAYKAAFSPDGRRLALSYQSDTVRIHDRQTGKLVHQLTLPADPRRDHEDPSDSQVTTLAYSPDGRLLVAGGVSDLLHLYDAQTLQEVGLIRRQGGTVAPWEWSLFSPDSRLLLVDNSVGWFHLVEVATGRSRLVMPRANALAFSPDGRLFVTGGKSAIVHFHDRFTGAELGQFRGHRSPITCLAFSPDGTQVISGSEDSSILVWDVPLHFRKRALRPLSAGEQLAMWESLSGDAKQAGVAISRLIDSGKSTVPFLASQLQPTSEPDRAKIDQLIRDLDHASFRVRESATRQLASLEEQATPILRQALTKTPSPETQRRLAQLLEQLGSHPLSGERVRSTRAVEVLEYLGDRDAQALLRHLAGGAHEGHLTREARLALRRLNPDRSP